MTEENKEMAPEELENDIANYEEDFEKEKAEAEQTLEEEKSKINKEIANYYGKDEIGIDELLSVDGKVKKYQDRLDFLNGKLKFDNEEDIPPYLKEIKDFNIKDTSKIESIISQIKASKDLTHLKENIKVSKLPVNDKKLAKVNEKLNMKIYRYNKLRGNEESEFSLIDLEEIYSNLSNALESNSFKDNEILFRFMCALGSYMSQNYEKSPYYVKTLSENIDYIGKFGKNLTQNEEFINSLNEVLLKFKK